MVDYSKDGVVEILIEANKSKANKDYIASLNKFAEALFFLEDEDKVDVLFSIADLYSEIEDFKNANKIYNDILKIEPENSGAWYGVAYTNELLGGDIKESLRSYEKAIELDKNYKEAYYYAATIYGDLNNLDKAIDYLEKVISINPEDFIALSDLGSIYESLGDFQKSEKYLLESININESYYLSRFNLGVVYKAIGRYEEAIKQYKKASELSNKRYPYLNMSALYIETEQLIEALEILTEGIEKTQDHILFYNRACVYKKLGKIDLALKDFNEAKRIDPVVLEWAKDDPDLMDIVLEEK